jgi:hypothetical protein
MNKEDEVEILSNPTKVLCAAENINAVPYYSEEVTLQEAILAGRIQSNNWIVAHTFNESGGIINPDNLSEHYCPLLASPRNLSKPGILGSPGNLSKPGILARFSYWIRKKLGIIHE